MTNKELLTLAFALGNMKHIKRSWVALGFRNAQNLAEHSYRVAVLALLIALHLSECGEEVDMAKILTMALLHDVGELLTGDLHNLQKAFVDRDELKAFGVLVKDQSLKDVYAEYTVGESLEAKVVDDADRLEALMTMVENYDDNKDLFSFFLGDKDNPKLSKIKLDITRSLFKLLTTGQVKPIDWIIEGSKEIHE